MSVDLQLLVPIHGTLALPACCHTVLNLDTDYSVWEKVEAIPSETLPDGSVASYFARPDDPDGDDCYGDVEADSYGKPLRWVKAGDLAVLLEAVADPKNTLSRAAAAYLAVLRPGHPIVLYWH